MLILTRVCTLVFAAALLAVFAACQGSGDADDTTRPIADGELTNMVLDLTEFGPDYAGLQAENGNGLRTLDQAVQGDLDPEDERSDLERFDWTSAFEQFYANPQASQQRSGVYGAGSTVNLFETAQGAEGYLEDSRGELTTQVGRTYDTVTIVDIQEFNADVRDGAAGSVIQANVKGDQGSTVSLWQSAIMFRHGRLVAVVGVYTFEEPQLEDSLKDLALRIDENITTALANAANAD
jgi:hypothetical protein